MRTPRLAPILVLLAVALPVSSAGAATTGAPGNSGVDQYQESVPSSGGRKKPVDRKTRDALDRQGSDGKALATALQNDGGVPAAAAAGGTGGGGTGGSGSSGGSGGSGRSGSGSGSSSKSTSGSGDSAASTAAGNAAASSKPSDRPPVAAASTAALDTKIGPLPLWSLMIIVLASAAGAVVLRRRGA